MFFKNQRDTATKKAWVEILLSIGALILSFFINKFGKAVWLSYVTLPIVLFAIVGVLKGISRLMASKKEPPQTYTEQKDLWSREELFSRLEIEPVAIDLFIDYNGKMLKVGVVTDYVSSGSSRSPYGTFENKRFYINTEGSDALDALYESFGDFKEKFISLHPDSIVKVTRISLPGEGTA